MEGDIFPIGSKVRVLSDGPLRGLKGTIIAINMIATPGEPTNCLYLVALDVAHQQEPQWLEFQEVALVGTLSE